MSRPFFSTNTNMFDESRITSTPTNLNGQNVIVSQGQQRRMFDVLNTSISGLPNANPQGSSYYPGQFVQAQRLVQPDGILFSFPPTQQPSMPVQAGTTQGCCCGMDLNVNQPMSYSNSYPQDIHQQMGMNELMKQMQLERYHQQQQCALQNARNNGIQAMDFHQLLSRNPFQLNLHRNVGTSSTDLHQCPVTELFPNLTDCCCALNFGQLHTPIDLHDKKKLILSQQPVPAAGHVSDVLEMPKSEKKTVSFKENCCGCDPVPKSVDQTNQVSENQQCETKPSLVMAMQTEPVARSDQSEQVKMNNCRCSGGNRRRVRNRRKRTQSIEYETVSESSSSSSEECSDGA